MVESRGPDRCRTDQSVDKSRLPTDSSGWESCTPLCHSGCCVCSPCRSQYIADDALRLIPKTRTEGQHCHFSAFSSWATRTRDQMASRQSHGEPDELRPVRHPAEPFGQVGVDLEADGLRFHPRTLARRPATDGFPIPRGARCTTGLPSSRPRRRRRCRGSFLCAPRPRRSTRLRSPSGSPCRPHRQVWSPRRCSRSR